MKARFLSTILIGYFAAACSGAQDSADPESTDSDTQSSQGDVATDGDEGPISGSADEPTQLVNDDESVPSDEVVVDDVADSEEIVDEIVEPDTIAPTLVSVFPEDQANGVFAKDVIEIEFSEAMDQAATEDAYVSADLPSTAVSFQWNEAGTRLTIVPNEDLIYDVGFPEDEVAANHYDYSLQGAKDLAGNALEETTLGFNMARMFLMASLPELAQTGAVLMSTGDTDNDIIVGAEDDGSVVRGFVSFGLPKLPQYYLDLMAVFHTEQVDVVGFPFDNLVDADHALCMSVETFGNAEDVRQLALSPPIADLSDDPAPGVREVDVTQAVEPLYDAHEGTVQFVLEFAKPTDGPGELDGVGFSVPQTWLAIAYLQE